MIGILVEKPSAARNFAKALGGMKGTYNGEEYVIVAARGHLYELAKPDAQVPASLVAQYSSWDLSKLPWNETDFSWRRERQKDTAAVLKDLKSVLGSVDEICCAGDVDPSGEGFLISAEILEELKLRPKKLSRLYFVDESIKEIQKGFVNRKPIPDFRQHDEYMMAWFRTRWDFLSMQFTRVASKCGDGKSVLRQGRLKSAMVVLVGDQLKLVDGYQKIPFYQNRFRDENGVVYTNPEEPTYPRPEDVPQVYHGSAVVVDSKTMKTSAPPKFMDLASLSAKLAAKGAKAKEVLSIYQKMYESQILSYPRTEDKVVTPEQFNDLLPKVDAIAKLVGVDPGLLTHRTPRSTHVKTGGAHGANRPGLNVPRSLDDLDQFGRWARDIYILLAKSYLASLAEDYEYEVQKGHVKDYPKFVGSVSVPKKPGWKAVYGTDLDEDDENGDNAKGLGTQAEPFVFEGFPPKPAAPTMKWLMSQLEKHDVGTGATRTSTYAEVTSEKSKYPLLIDKRGKISMSEYGEMSYTLLPGTHIGDLKITERVQQQMRDIAAGKASAEDCLREIRQMVVDDIETMKANSKNIKKGSIDMAGNFADKEYYEGTWRGKQVKFNRVFRGHRFTDDECERLLAGEEIEVLNLKAKTGSTYGVVGALDNLEFNGHKYVGFAQKGFVGENKVPAAWCGHTFTQDELTALEAGVELEITDAVSKKTGNKFSCKLKWTKRDDGKMGLVPSFD